MNWSSLSCQKLSFTKKGCFDSIWLPQFPTSSASFTNALENLITVWNVKQATGLHCI